MCKIKVNGLCHRFVSGRRSFHPFASNMSEFKPSTSQLKAASAGSHWLTQLTGTLGQAEDDQPWRNSHGGWSGIGGISILVQEAETRGLEDFSTSASPSSVYCEHLKQSRVLGDSVDSATQGQREWGFDNSVRLSRVKQVPCPKWATERKSLWVLGGAKGN